MKKLVAVLGPTACGKSALALELARRSGFEIVNCDSRQVFRGMDIGTAKPSPEERKEIPHHLLDLVEPDRRFSAGDFAREARPLLESLWKAGKRPLLVGGTGFYFEALVQGLPKDTGETRLRAELEDRLDAEGLDSLVQDLRRLSPEADGLIDVRNPRRVVRALEIVLASGEPLGKALEKRVPLEAEVLPIVVTMPRAILEQRIAERTGRMIGEGLEAEARAVFDRFGEESPGMKTIGYSEWVPFFLGASTVGKVDSAIRLHTRQYAKRQETWFRKRPGVPFTDLSKPGVQENVLREVEAFLGK